MHNHRQYEGTVDNSIVESLVRGEEVLFPDVKTGRFIVINGERVKSLMIVMEEWSWYDNNHD